MTIVDGYYDNLSRLLWEQGVAVHLHLVAVQICGANSYWGEQEKCPVD